MKPKKCVLCIIVMMCCTIHIFAVNQYQKEADILHQLGLFRGTGSGYQLEKTFTRAEGAAMLVRLLGKEADALLTSGGGSPFADVEGHWSAPYVAYCYANGITKGTGEAAYSPDAEMTGKEYATLLLRSLGYANVNPDNVEIAAAEYALAGSGELKELFTGVFLRDKMVFLSYRALQVKDLSGVTLLERLIQNNVVSEQQVQSLQLVPAKHIR